MANDTGACQLENVKINDLQAWYAVLEQCGDDLDFLWHYGRRLNRLKRYDEAVEVLETVLLRAPDSYQAQIEYAIALAGTGQISAAYALLAQVSADADLDEATRRELDSMLWRSRWALAQQRHVAEIMYGYDDNLFGYARQGPFDLTFPTGRVEVDPQSKPIGGSFLRAELRAEGNLLGWGEQPLRYGFYWRGRASSGKPSHQWGGVLEKNNTWRSGDYLFAAYQGIDLGSQWSLHEYRLGAGLGFDNDNCAQRVGGEWSTRQYPIDLDGRYHGLVWQGRCRLGQATWKLRHGRDEATGRRPGGDQTHTALAIGMQANWRGALWVIDFEWSWQHDSRGYSPLLEEGRKRRLTRGFYRLEYRPIFDFHGWQPFVSLESFDQRGNLPLFTVRGRSVALGFSHAW